MKYFLTVILIAISCFFTDAQELSKFFVEADTFFENHVVTGIVNYKKAKSDPVLLNSLVNQIAEMDLDQKSNDEKRAFFINSYNLLVIHSIVQSYPVSSPMDIEGFFDLQIQKVAGESMTLNDIENKKLRAAFSYDPRFHFVLVCAAVSCPKIIAQAYMPVSIERQLSNQTRIAINDANFIRVDKGQKKVEVSQIFEWYIDDFKTKGMTLIDFVNQYRKYPIPDDYSFGFYQYDWKLNGL